MTVLLTNLSARTPTMEDLDAITELIRLCDIAEYNISNCTKEDVLFQWQSAGFNLKTDAWVIVTTRGQLAGYATLWDKEHVSISAFVRVHPNYRGRGIGTLLLRLVEQRARLHIPLACPGVRIALSNTVSNVNEAARHLLEREGYSAVSHFWRIVFEIDGVPSLLQCPEGVISCEDYYSQGRRKVEVVVDSQNLSSSTRLYTRYEKELRAGKDVSECDMPSPQLVGA